MVGAFFVCCIRVAFRVAYHPKTVPTICFIKNESGIYDMSQSTENTLFFVKVLKIRHLRKIGIIGFKSHLPQSKTPVFTGVFLFCVAFHVAYL